MAIMAIWLLTMATSYHGYYGCRCCKDWRLRVFCVYAVFIFLFLSIAGNCCGASSAGDWGYYDSYYSLYMICLYFGVFCFYLLRSCFQLAGDWGYRTGALMKATI
jgi:hypothetical protein